MSEVVDDGLAGGCPGRVPVHSDGVGQALVVAASTTPRATVTASRVVVRSDNRGSSRPVSPPHERVPMGRQVGGSGSDGALRDADGI